jgi:hypothetical protein
MASKRTISGPALLHTAGSSQCDHGRHRGEEAARSNGNRPEWTAKVVGLSRAHVKLGIGSTVVRAALVGSVMQLRDALLHTIRECVRGSATDAMGMKGSGQVHHNLDGKIRNGTTRWVRAGGQIRDLVEVRPTARAKREIIAVCCARAAGREQVLL